jgi:hypothetical protein
MTLCICSQVFYYSVLRVVWDWVHFVHQPLFGLMYQPWMTDDDECGAGRGMRTGTGNQSAQNKPMPVPLCPPQTPTWLDLWSNLGRRSIKLLWLLTFCLVILRSPIRYHSQQTNIVLPSIQIFQTWIICCQKKIILTLWCGGGATDLDFRTNIVYRFSKRFTYRAPALCFYFVWLRYTVSKCTHTQSTLHAHLISTCKLLIYSDAPQSSLSVVQS